MVSDVHFPHHFKNGWKAFKAWHSEYKPGLTILDGDIIDLAQLSSFTVNAVEHKSVIPSIKLAVKEINEISKNSSKTMISLGNHEDRWDRSLFSTKAQALHGAIGLTLYDQMRFHGLQDQVETVKECVDYPGILIGKTDLIVRHGHKKAGRFGAQNLASKMLRDSPHNSQIIGHHHRAELKAHTSLGKTVVAVANPCLTGDHEYYVDPNWQRGFTIIELWGHPSLDGCRNYTIYPIIMAANGSFAFGGKVYKAP